MELCCFGSQALNWIEANDGLAAWLQAIGGLIGIGIAIWAGGAPARQELARMQAAREDFYRVLSDASDFAMNTLKPLVEAVEDDDHIVAILVVDGLKNLEISAVLKKALREPMTMWPSASLFVAVYDFVASVTQLKQLSVAMLNGASITLSENWRASEFMVRARVDAVREAKSEIDEEISKLRRLN